MNEERFTLVVANHRLSDADLSAALAGTLDGQPWVRMDLPLDAVAVGRSLDLADAGTSARFSQRYLGSCDPSDATNSRVCWLLENYEAGATGLRGSIAVRRGGDSVDGVYEVYWEGMTDRFEGPPQWHAHGTSGSFDLSAANVRSVGL